MSTRFPRHRRPVGLAIVTFFLLGVNSAEAATPLGQTFIPPLLVACEDNTNLQSTSSSASYAAPTAGVITSWSVQAPAANAPVMKFKVGRPEVGSVFTVIGESAGGFQALTASQLNVFATRIPVQAGDVIGYAVPPGVAQCMRNDSAGAGFVRHTLGGDVPVGAGGTFNTFANSQLDVAASLEGDADGDGFGDETQDGCPSDAGTQGSCQEPPGPDVTPPDTTITKGPKEKTKKWFATFEFISSEPGSSFECSFDKKSFAACVSPEDEKVGKGKHTFQVRATDQSGNTDPSPATDNWKVKKKRKK